MRKHPQRFDVFLSRTFLFDIILFLFFFGIFLFRRFPLSTFSANPFASVTLRNVHERWKGTSVLCRRQSRPFYHIARAGQIALFNEAAVKMLH